MSELRAFVCSVGQKLGRSAADVEPCVEVLAEHWYDTVNSLVGLSAEELVIIGLPLRFAKELIIAIQDRSLTVSTSPHVSRLPVTSVQRSAPVAKGGGKAAGKGARHNRVVKASSLGTTYKLTYFDIRGRAEVARWLFAVAKQDYTDDRFSFSMTPGDWSSLKRPEFDAAKASGKLDVACGQVPILTVNGTQIGQSKAVERYLAGALGFFGGSALEGAQIDQQCENVRDSKDAYQKVRGMPDGPEKNAAMTKWFAEDLPTKLKAIEKSLPEGPGPFVVGGKVSLADLTFYHYLLAPKGFFDDAEKAKAAFQDCPKIKRALEATDEIAELKAWIAKRPDTML